ncbi:MAG: hypothetical protein HQK99_16275 [Nitrospirae bacterium]|nr:hypothetical protein [Nitrospirota bacterium]
MAQGILKYEYGKDESKSGMTALGGLPVYMDFAVSSGLLKLIDENLKICSGSQGWTDREIVFSLILLNLVGGDSLTLHTAKAGGFLYNALPNGIR